MAIITSMAKWLSPMRSACSNRTRTSRLANYGSFLEQFPPEYECEIIDNTSWSCAHGVERWRSDCGCNGGKPGWNQAWRKPLRDALDELRDALIPLTDAPVNSFSTMCGPRATPTSTSSLTAVPNPPRTFFIDHQSHPLTDPERVRALELMEMQRHAQLMYTSCGWFFDDISGIETVQVIAYAARVLQLAQTVFGLDAASLEPSFLERLKQAHSNVASAGDGARIYQDKVSTMELGLEQVVAHYAISSFFSTFTEETELFCYSVRRLSYETFTSGRGRLAIGRAHIASAITGQKKKFSFAVLHFGDQNITAAVKAYDAAEIESFEAFVKQAADQVQRADFPKVIRLLDSYYGHVDYSLTSLFTDEQRRIVQVILNTTLRHIENSMTTIYEDHASLLHFLSQAGLPKPPALTLAAGFAHQCRLAPRPRRRPDRPGRSPLLPHPGQGRPGAAGDADALLHRRPAHEARHDRIAHVFRLSRDAGARRSPSPASSRNCPSN